MRRIVTLEVGDQRRWPASILITKVQREQTKQNTGGGRVPKTTLNDPSTCEIARAFSDNFNDRTNTNPASWGVTSTGAIPYTAQGGSGGSGGPWTWGVNADYAYMISYGHDNNISVSGAELLGTQDGLFFAPWEKSFNFTCKVWIEKPSVANNTVNVIFGNQVSWPPQGPVLIISGNNTGFTWGLQNEGYTSVVYADLSYGGSTWLRVRFMINDYTKILHGKVWPDGDTEPADWQLTLPLTGPMPSFWAFQVERLTHTSGNGAIEVRWDDINYNCEGTSSGNTATVGELYGSVYVATGDGVTSSWSLPFPYSYVPSTLTVAVNGVGQQVTEVDPIAGTFSLSFAPAVGAEITAMWRVAG